MKNIAKLLVGILFSALVMAPSYAGEMTVTGGATATYSIGGDDSGSGKTLGISNELDFTASGELDNGYTWKYQVQLDGASTANDDTRLEIGTDMGKIGFYVSEGGMSKELHGVGALGPGFDYHSPASGTAGSFKTGCNNVLPMFFVICRCSRNFVQQLHPDGKKTLNKRDLGKTERM